ncbi:PE family protein, partial [Mycobacterium alsense]
MSYVIALPDAVAAAAANMERISAALATADVAAAGATTNVVSPGADEVSGVVAALFSSYAKDYRAEAAQAATFHAQFVSALTASAQSYASAEAYDCALAVRAL